MAGVSGGGECALRGEGGQPISSRILNFPEDSWETKEYFHLPSFRRIKNLMRLEGRRTAKGLRGGGGVWQGLAWSGVRQGTAEKY